MSETVRIAHKAVLEAQKRWREQLLAAGELVVEEDTWDDITEVVPPETMAELVAC